MRRFAARYSAPWNAWLRGGPYISREMAGSQNLNAYGIQRRRQGVRIDLQWGERVSVEKHPSGAASGSHRSIPRRRLAAFATDRAPNCGTIPENRPAQSPGAAANSARAKITFVTG